jgi:hypothetical protein
VSIVAVIAVAVGCGSSSHDSNFGDGDDASADGGGGGDDTGGGGDDAISFGDSGEASTCATHCSSDLHSVLDCNNKVVTTCPMDQGCAGNGCVPACDSAKANKSTFGCDYYSVDPDIITEGAGACFAAFIANTWTAPVTITADHAGMTLNVASFARIPSGNGQALTYQPLTNGQLQPGEVAILFFNRFPGNGAAFDCPSGITPAITTTDGAAHGTVIGNAFHFTAPVVAYDIFPFGGGQTAATSATLLLPTTAWDTNYIAVNAFRQSVIAASAGAKNFIEVVAQEDNTTVTISPTAAIIAGTGVVGTGAGVPHGYVINKGQYLQITQDGELSGSPIQADKPVGLWGGATCLNIDVSAAACDSAHQQIPPVKALGHEYAVVRYRSRVDGTDESTYYRFVGAVNGTTLTYEPSTPAGAPTTLSSGQVGEFQIAAPFVVKSQDDLHPFYMSGHMTGGQNAMDRGDPEFVNIIPPQEYLASYVFFTDPTYPETNLVLVRTKSSQGFKDVTLDCAGVLTGWQPLGSSGLYEYTRIDLVRHNFAPQGSCNNGRHEIHSDAPFGLTIWGWGSSESTGFVSTYVSYAYPAGASVQPINTVVVPPTPR